MGQIAGLTTFITNTVISSADMNGNFTIVSATYNAHDIAATGVHNVGAGSVVGTTLTQTLTNKTLTSPVIAAMASAFTIPAAASTPAANTMVNESIIKAWGIIYEATVVAGYNVTSAEDCGVGCYRVNLTTAFSSSDYVVVATPVFNPGTGHTVFVDVVRNLSSQFDLIVYDDTGTAKDNQVMFIAIGAQ